MLPLFSYTCLKKRVKIKTKICVKNVMQWDVDPRYIFFNLKRKAVQAHREGTCPITHAADNKNCISSISNITIAQKKVTILLSRGPHLNMWWIHSALLDCKSKKLKLKQKHTWTPRAKKLLQWSKVWCNLYSFRLLTCTDRNSEI